MRPEVSELLPLICVDTREPEGGGWEPFFETPCVRGKLDSGDYSIVGCGEVIAVERKTLDDLIGCLTTSRERFTHELQRGQRIPFLFAGSRRVAAALAESILLRWWKEHTKIIDAVRKATRGVKF